MFLADTVNALLQHFLLLCQFKLNQNIHCQPTFGHFKLVKQVAGFYLTQSMHYQVLVEAFCECLL
jgi:hypothetical protein